MTLRMFLSSVDAGSLDKAITDVIDVLRENGIGEIGPIPLPTGFSSFKPYSGNVTHRRMMDIENPSKELISKLDDFNIPSGVKVEMKCL